MHQVVRGSFMARPAMRPPARSRRYPMSANLAGSPPRYLRTLRPPASSASPSVRSRSTASTARVLAIRSVVLRREFSNTDGGPFMRPEPSATCTPERDAGPLQTRVELTWLEGRIEHWIRFGHEVGVTILDRRRRVVRFAPNSVFAFVRCRPSARAATSCCASGRVCASAIASAPIPPTRTTTSSPARRICASCTTATALPVFLATYNAGPAR